MKAFANKRQTESNRPGCILLEIIHKLSELTFYILNSVYFNNYRYVDPSGIIIHNKSVTF